VSTQAFWKRKKPGEHAKQLVEEEYKAQFKTELAAGELMHLPELSR